MAVRRPQWLTAMIGLPRLALRGGDVCRIRCGADADVSKRHWRVRMLVHARGRMSRMPRYSCSRDACNAGGTTNPLHNDPTPNPTPTSPPCPNPQPTRNPHTNRHSPHGRSITLDPITHPPIPLDRPRLIHSRIHCAPHSRPARRHDGHNPPIRAKILHAPHGADDDGHKREGGAVAGTDKRRGEPEARRRVPLNRASR